MHESRQIHINGIVQGVGFRPFVYNLARKWKIYGRVENNSFGVHILAEGEPDRMEGFVAELRANPPVLARITGFREEPAQVSNFDSFEILKSHEDKNKFTLVSPDVSICPECLAELLDPSDRRYRYPFLNCTNCGPRFTIIRDIPYDRPKTTMAGFPMCPDCRREYENPANRRFHAQPIACPVCGPQVWLEDADGQRSGGDPLKEAISLLKAGKIIAVKGLGGFHLAVDAGNDRAVADLRLRKHRYEKPLAVMCLNAETAGTFAEIHPRELEILESQQRPICLLRKRKNTKISPRISPDNDYFGVMLPYTPLHVLLLAEGDFTALVMTSGNISEEPIVQHNAEARERLRNIADYFLMNNRGIYQRADDSVVRLMDNQLSCIRRSRGFVPQPIIGATNLPSVLALGAEQKNTICLNRENFFFLSQHIGDLENIETLEFLEQCVEHLQKIHQIEPQAIACDMHPEYLSAKWAAEQEILPVIPIQHHHAHLASCMAENGLAGDVIGLSLDGTGYGPDGTLWGGEILVGNELEFKRAGYFDPVYLPGGSKAIREPWRMAWEYARQCGIDLPVGDLFPDVSAREVSLLEKMVDRKINCPVTSSCGRLFDAVAAIAGLRHRVGYEGQAAMQLESLLDNLPEFTDEEYKFEIRNQSEQLILDWRPVFQQLIDDWKRQVPSGVISYKFHAGLVTILSRVVSLVSQKYSLKRVTLSGGCFQNRYLTEQLACHLKAGGFEVFTHHAVPANDGGIALGQAYIAASQFKSGKVSDEIFARVQK